ncbi:phosphatidylglycerophosphatase GEP4, partial [Tremellales sp. Uapishka_1]
MAPVRLPNSVIYLISLVRPKQLRPDLRVPTLGNVDFPGLKKQGFNAVVIDKDNCLTLPSSDDIYPPFQPAWKTLLSTFPPGRVLVVSNSSGTKKDVGGIAAETLALSLAAPVLRHALPKPGCAPDILAYFRGDLGKPQTTRHDIVKKARAVEKVEEEEEAALLDKWRGEVASGLLLGPLVDREGKKVEEVKKGKGLESDMVDRQHESARNDREEQKVEQTTKKEEKKEQERERLRILVVGDRLFTDTLLARRLSLYLPEAKKDDPVPSVLSIQTMTLPQPKDVRILRWLEDRLTASKLKESAIDWNRYIVPSYGSSEPEVEVSAPPAARSSWARLNPFTRWKQSKAVVGKEEGPAVTWNPKSWKAKPLATAAGRMLMRVLRAGGRGVARSVKSGWTRARRRTNEEGTTRNTG